MSQTVEEAINGNDLCVFEGKNGGYKWARTTDLHDVNVTL